MKTALLALAFVISVCTSFGRESKVYRSSIAVQNTEEALISFIYAVQESHQVRPEEINLDAGLVTTAPIEYDRSVNGIRTRLSCKVENGILTIQFVELTKLEVPTQSWVPTVERKMEKEIRESLFNQILSVIASGKSLDLVTEFKTLQEEKTFQFISDVQLLNLPSISSPELNSGRFILVDTQTKEVYILTETKKISTLKNQERHENNDLSEAINQTSSNH